MARALKKFRFSRGALDERSPLDSPQ